MRSLPNLAAPVLLLAGVAACSGYHPTPAAFHQALNQPYVLGAGDSLRITVFEQDGLTNTYSVDQAGYIAFPLIGGVPAHGRTAKQIGEDIAVRLGNGYIRNPDVSVEIDRYRPVFIMGGVGAAGQYSYVPGMTVQKAVAVAGGFSARANQANADVTREINGEIVTGRLSMSDPLLPGDTLYVRERIF